MITLKQGEMKKLITALSKFFPVREDRIYVIHKSVIDWLVDVQRGNDDEAWFVNEQEAHKEVGTRCLSLLHTLDNPFGNRAVAYALRHGILHLCEGCLIQEARDLFFRFEWLLSRARLGPIHALIEDANRVVSLRRDDRALHLVRSALRLAQVVT